MDIPTQQQSLPTIPGTTSTSSKIGGPVPVASIGSRRRAALSLTDLRTPIVENLMSMLPSGHDKAFKYALYNVLALVLAAVCITTLMAAYCILEPFIVPLLWALLCGSVIYPFKYRTVTFTKEWLGMVKGCSSPLSFQLAFTPFRAVDSISESIGTRVVTWWKWIVTGCGGFFLTYLIYHNPPVTFGLILYWICLVTFKTLVWLISWVNGKFVVAVSAVYLAMIFHYIYGPGSESQSTPKSTSSIHIKHEDKQKDSGGGGDESDLASGGECPQSCQAIHHNPFIHNRLLRRILSITTWLSLFTYICRFLPYPLLILVFVSLVTGTVVYIRKRPFLPSFATKYAAILALFGVSGKLSNQSSRGVSRKGSVQQFSKSRRNTQLIGTPSPATGAAISQLKESSSGTPIGGSVLNVNVGDQRVVDQGPDELMVKKLRPPVDLKIDSDIQPYSSSADILGFYSNDTIPSSIETGCEETEDEVDGILDSNTFLYGLLCACLIVQIWNRMWLLHLLPIPVVYFGIKRMCISFGMKDYLEKTIYRPFLEFYTTKTGPSRKF